MVITCPRVVEELIEVLVTLGTLVYPVLPLATPATDGRLLVLSKPLPVIAVVIDTIVV
jgi:hypothetical protein